MQKILLLIPLFIFISTTNSFAVTTAVAKSEWVFIFYGAADNNLEESIMLDINEIESVKIDPKKAKVVALIDRGGQWAGDQGWTTTRAYEIGHDPLGHNNIMANESRRLSIPALNISAESDQTELDMSNPQTLQLFLNFALRNYPAKHYALIISNHGDSWFPAKVPNSKFVIAPKGIAYDDTSLGNGIDIFELKDAIGKSFGAKRQLDVLAFDACLMSAFEVLYELKDVAKIITASAETIPDTGFPYTQILQKFSEKQKIGPTDLANIFVKEFINAYTLGNIVERPGDISNDVILNSWDMRSISKLAPLINQLGREQLFFNYPTNADLVWGAIHYSLDGHIDLGNYCDRVEADQQAPVAIIHTCQIIKKVMDQTNLASAHGKAFLGAQGLSVFLPIPSEYSGWYNGELLSFAQDFPGWRDFILSFKPSVVTDVGELSPLPIELNETNNNVTAYIFNRADTDYYQFDSRLAKSIQITLTVPDNTDYEIEFEGIMPCPSLSNCPSTLLNISVDGPIYLQSSSDGMETTTQLLIPSGLPYQKFQAKVYSYSATFSQERPYMLKLEYL